MYAALNAAQKGREALQRQGQSTKIVDNNINNLQQQIARANASSVKGNIQKAVNTVSMPQYGTDNTPANTEVLVKEEAKNALNGIKTTLNTPTSKVNNKYEYLAGEAAAYKIHKEQEMLAAGRSKNIDFNAGEANLKNMYNTTAGYAISNNKTLIRHDKAANQLFVPSEKQSGLYASGTGYDQDWNVGSGQKELNDKWRKQGKPSDKGIATLDGRYLVATTENIAKVGDNIDVVIEDGTTIRCTVADTKEPTDVGYTEWGHLVKLPSGNKKPDVIEWESKMTPEEFKTYEGHYNDAIFLGEWKGQKVEYIINNNREYE